MLINEKVIRSFNPCEDGIDNFVKHYPKWKGKLSKLLALENIPYDNKIWLACKVTPESILKQWSVECAENVLDIYESRYPNDTRVRDYIEGTKKYLNGEITKGELQIKRNAAADYAATAAADAAYANAAYYAADYADYADYARDTQETINLSILIALLENEGL